MKHVRAERDKALARLQARGNHGGFIANAGKPDRAPANPVVPRHDPNAGTLATIVNCTQRDGHRSRLAGNIESDRDRRAEWSTGWSAEEHEASIEGPGGRVSRIAQLAQTGTTDETTVLRLITTSVLQLWVCRPPVRTPARA